MQLGGAGAGSWPQDTCWWKEEPAPLGKEGCCVGMTPTAGGRTEDPAGDPGTI